MSIDTVIMNSYNYCKDHKNGNRSSNKLIEIHSFISDSIKMNLSNKYKFFHLNENGEKCINGILNKKNIDITIEKNNSAIYCIEVKSIMRNYSQNSNNYFENMTSATANIRYNNINMAQVVILPRSVPYFNKSGNVVRYDSIKEHHIQKYITLMAQDKDYFMLRPNNLLFYMYDVCDDGRICKYDTIKNEGNYSKNVISFIEEYSDYDNFITRIVNECKTF